MMRRYWPGTDEGQVGVELGREWPWTPSFGKVVKWVQAFRTTGLSVEGT